jgi:deoxycytidylate deaminase
VFFGGVLQAVPLKDDKMVDDRFLFIAKREALKSNLRTHKMSCIVISKRKAYLMLRAFNQIVYDSRFNNGKRSIHAEEALIVKAAKRGMKLSGVTVIVYRHKRGDGSPGSSRPCSRCYFLLKRAGVRRVVFFEGGWVSENI